MLQQSFGDRRACCWLLCPRAQPAAAAHPCVYAQGGWVLTLPFSCTALRYAEYQAVTPLLWPLARAAAAGGKGQSGAVRSLGARRRLHRPNESLYFL